MEELFQSLLKNLLISKTPNSDVLIFYQTASRIYPAVVEEWYKNHLKERFDNLQVQAKAVLTDYDYLIYSDLKVIQAENNHGKIHEQLKDVFEFSNSFNEENDLHYYLEAGFWLNSRHYEILQISQLYPQIVN